MLIRKLLTTKKKTELFTILYYQYFEKIQTKNEIAVIVVPFPMNISKSIIYWIG